MPNIYDLAIVGMGPAGISVATAIRDSSIIKNTICFERGKGINKDCAIINNGSCCNSNVCHVISGIGGASNLSSGKFSLFPAGSGLKQFFTSERELIDLMVKVIQSLEKEIELKKVDIESKTIFDAQDYYSANNIVYKYYDVFEFDGNKYSNYLISVLKFLVDNGLTVHTNSEVLTIKRENGTPYYIINTQELGEIQQYFAKKVVLAVGSSEINKSLIATLINAYRTDYEIGVRVESESEYFGTSLNSHGDLKLRKKSGRTYCVTKGGAIVSYRNGEYCFLEGYIDSNKRTAYSNLAVLIKSDKEKELLEFLNNYKHLFYGTPVKQKYTDYLLGYVSSEPIYTTLSTARLGDINKMFTDSINSALQEFINHVIIEAMHVKKDELTIIAPELKTMIDLKLSDQFGIAPDLYIVGAATGKFRGILQSICSGIQCSKYILRG